MEELVWTTHDTRRYYIPSTGAYDVLSIISSEIYVCGLAVSRVFLIICTFFFQLGSCCYGMTV